LVKVCAILRTIHSRSPCTLPVSGSSADWLSAWRRNASATSSALPGHLRYIVAFEARAREAIASTVTRSYPISVTSSAAAAKIACSRAALREPGLDPAAGGRRPETVVASISVINRTVPYSFFYVDVVEPAARRDPRAPPARNRAPARPQLRARRMGIRPAPRGTGQPARRPQPDRRQLGQPHQPRLDHRHRRTDQRPRTREYRTVRISAFRQYCATDKRSPA